MLERFINGKEQILAFTKNFLYPFGNNLAEQAIRMMRVKQKVSGCFRSEQGAKDFATIKSYIATAKKQEVPVMQALAPCHQWMPFSIEALNSYVNIYEGGKVHTFDMADHYIQNLLALQNAVKDTVINGYKISFKGLKSDMQLDTKAEITITR